MASGRILIVDDDTNICELLRLYIEKRAMRRPSPTTARPLENVRYRESRPDPAGPDDAPGGWLYLCRQIRQESQVPIVVLTALDGEEAQVKAFPAESR